MVTTRPNGTFNGTLHHKGESSEYYVEQSVRRPRRQRIIAFGLLVLMPVFVAYAVVDLPRANTEATVLGVIALTDSGPEPLAVSVSYTWAGALVTTTIPIPGADLPDLTTRYPVGSKVLVHAARADDGAPAATLPTNQPVGGTLLAVSAGLGALLLLRAARRNEAKGPLTMPVYLDPR